MSNFMTLPNQYMLIALTITALAFCTFRKHAYPFHLAQQIVFAAVGCALFIFSVVNVWWIGASPALAVAGLLPVSDANSFFTCAYGLLQGEPLQGMCLRRPLYGLMLATLIWFSALDLQIALVLQALAVGFSAAIFGIAISRNWGLASSVLGFSFLYAFYSVVGTMTMTAQAGLLWGCLAGVFFLRWAKEDRKLDGFLMLFILTLALNARAGAFLVLPAVIFWVLCCRGPIKNNVGLAGILTLGVLSGFAVNIISLNFYGGALDQMHSNFSYVLYGLASGGKGWTYFDVQFPAGYGLWGGAGQTKTQFIYEHAFDLIIQQPFLFVFGYFKGLIRYGWALFDFISFEPVRRVMEFFWAVGLLSLIWRWKNIFEGRLLIIMIGVIFSAPFLTFDGGARVYAATIAFDALTIALGMSVIRKKIFRQVSEPAFVNDESLFSHSATVVLLALSCALVLIPAIVAPVESMYPIEMQASSCSDGDKMWVSRAGGESPMVELTSSENRALWPLSVDIHDLKNNMDRFLHGRQQLSTLDSEHILIWLYQRSAEGYGNRTHAIFRGHRENIIGKHIVLCVAPTINKQDYHIRHAELVDTISQ